MNNGGPSALVAIATAITALSAGIACGLLYGPPGTNRDVLMTLVCGALVAAALLCLIVILVPDKRTKPGRPVQRVYTSAQTLLGGLAFGREGFRENDLQGAFFALDCTAQAFYQPGVDGRDSFILQFAKSNAATHLKLVDIIRAAEKDGRAVWSQPGTHWREVDETGQPVPPHTVSERDGER